MHQGQGRLRQLFSEAIALHSSVLIFACTHKSVMLLLLNSYVFILFLSGNNKSIQRNGMVNPNQSRTNPSRIEVLLLRLSLHDLQVSRYGCATRATRLGVGRSRQSLKADRLGVPFRTIGFALNECEFRCSISRPLPS
jgi:hypothetical protein